MHRFRIVLAGLAAVASIIPGQALSEGTPCVSNPQPITYGQMFLCNLSQNLESDTYTFTAGESALVLITSTRNAPALDPCVALYVPGDSIVACPYMDNGYSRLFAILNPGDYSMRVYDRPGPNNNGNYDVTLDRIMPPANARPIMFGDSLTDSLDPRGDQDLFTFYATAGSTVILMTTRLTGGGLFHPCIELVRPDRVVLGGEGHCTSGATNQLQSHLELTGTYTVIVREAGSGSPGDYALQLKNCPNPPNAPCIVGVEPLDPEGSETLLGTAAPNPFTESTVFRFHVSRAADAELRIYDMAGQLVRELVSPRRMQGGEYAFRWDGRFDDGHRVSSGVYFYQLTLGGHREARRVVLMK